MGAKLPRVLIVDDHPVVRMGLRALVEQTGRYEVAGEAGTPAEAVQALARAQPDVLILDLMLGDGAARTLPLNAARWRPASASWSFRSMTKRFMPSVCSWPGRTATS